MEFETTQIKNIEDILDAKANKNDKELDDWQKDQIEVPEPETVTLKISVLLEDIKHIAEAWDPDLNEKCMSIRLSDHIYHVDLDEEKYKKVSAMIDKREADLFKEEGN